MDRRRFLQLAAAAPGLLASGSLLAAPGTPDWQRTLVLVELVGGNDGLNTVIPFKDPGYRSLRPTLAIKNALEVDAGLGLHPAFKPLMYAWDAGELAVVPGVGAGEPGQDHALAAWTMDSLGVAARQGWLAALFEANNPPAALMAWGAVLGMGDPGPLTGAGARVVEVDAPDRFASRGLGREAAPIASNPALAHLMTITAPTTASVKLHKALERVPALKAPFPTSHLGRQLAVAAQLMRGGLPVPVIKISHHGYDTHALQAPRHGALLGELAEALAAFRSAMLRDDLWGRALVVVGSEFGRTAAENSARGTDHGLGASWLMLGGEVSGGVKGAHPSLEDLDRGALRITTPLASLWATVASGWWGLKPTAPLSAPPIERLLR